MALAATAEWGLLMNWVELFLVWGVIIFIYFVVTAPSNSLLKNLKSSAFVLGFSCSYKRSVRFGSECSRLVATLSL